MSLGRAHITRRCKNGDFYFFDSGGGFYFLSGHDEENGATWARISVWELQKSAPKYALAHGVSCGTSGVFLGTYTSSNYAKNHQHV